MEPGENNSTAEPIDQGLSNTAHLQKASQFATVLLALLFAVDSAVCAFGFGKFLQKLGVVVPAAEVPRQGGWG